MVYATAQGNWYCRGCRTYPFAGSALPPPTDLPPPPPAPRPSKKSHRSAKIVIASIAFVTVLIIATAWGLSVLNPPPPVRLEAVNCELIGTVIGGTKYVEKVQVGIENTGSDTAKVSRITVRFHGTNIVDSVIPWLGPDIPATTWNYKATWNWRYDLKDNASNDIFAVRLIDSSAGFTLDAELRYDGIVHAACKPR
ncbi:MAG TPA: hypothetical protein VI893_01670 [Thermoplasmata archaeon]|nr:hypothetical protein [Thermoplasmata archaeon]